MKEKIDVVKQWESNKIELDEIDQLNSRHTFQKRNRQGGRTFSDLANFYERAMDTKTRMNMTNKINNTIDRANHNLI